MTDVCTSRFARYSMAGVVGAAILAMALSAPALAEKAKKASKAATSTEQSQTSKPAAPDTAEAPSANPSRTASAESSPKVERETFGEWELECFEPKVNGLKCQIGQRLVAKESTSLVLAVSMAYSPASKKDVVQFVLPLNFMLKPGVELAIGEAKTVIQVDRCSAQGCFVEGVAAGDIVEAMNKGETADVKVLANPQKRLVIPFSLKGFSTAYAKMKKMNEG